MLHLNSVVKRGEMRTKDKSPDSAVPACLHAATPRANNRVSKTWQCLPHREDVWILSTPQPADVFCSGEAGPGLAGSKGAEKMHVHSPPGRAGRDPAQHPPTALVLEQGARVLFVKRYNKAKLLS